MTLFPTEPSFARSLKVSPFPSLEITEDLQMPVLMQFVAQNGNFT